MAAGVAWKPFVAGFPVASAIHPSVTVPRLGLSTSQSGAVPRPLPMNQLHFNLGKSGTTVEQLTTRFRKPQPIVIERISEKTETPFNSVPFSHTTLPSAYPVLPSVSSSLSSDRLALAVHLAKKDVKKVKELGAESVLVPPDDDAQHKVTSAKGKGSLGKKLKTKSGKSKSLDVLPEDTVTLRQRVHHAVKRQEASAKRQHEMHFYPAQREDDGYESDRERKQASEIRKLRKELHRYMRQMEELKNERPEVVRKKDKRLKRRRDGEVRLSDEEVDHRQVTRADEQAARSARMLYMLQRQIQEIEDELNKTGRGIRHTKKSQTLSRLAAAHRGAVRALQTFISHAPLQPNISHGLPPMYQELSTLIRQLSLLAAQLHIGGEDLDELKKIEDQEKKIKSEEQHVLADEEGEKPSAFIQEVADRMPQDTKKILTPIKQAVTSSPDPTPERDAALKAGLSALLRAKDRPVQMTGVKQGTQQKPVLLQAAKPVKPVKQAVLLPAELKLKRQRTQQTAKRVKIQALDHAHFAKETVSSILKKAPSGEGPDKPKSPPRTLAREGPWIPERDVSGSERRHREEYVSPRMLKKEYEQQFGSSRNPRVAGGILPTHRELVEREVERQRWLDEEAERRIHELERIRRVENLRRSQRSPEILLSRRVIAETEEAIRSRLKPLLDRAEVIADTDVNREKQKKKSLQHQLGKLASQTTMNQADLLAEKVLDDILEETVVEMQRLELEEDAESQASDVQNSSTLENILQKLQNFEKVEEEIRQHWVHVKYADVERESNKASVDRPTNRPIKDPKPIIFTRPTETETHHLQSQNTKTGFHQQLRSDKRTLEGDGLSETNSFSSLVEEPNTDHLTGELNAQSSHIKGPFQDRAKVNSLRRPKVVLNVPKEMRASIASYRNRFNMYLRATATHEQGEFDPCGLLNSNVCTSETLFCS
ncbi:protein moonraker-like isoform X2 [Montipora capricornis]|uniref:protein moonraker-like isoform X2 n=1 Tax=Montipora capricornis TaxID=246305 RepID=UPI0035F20598